MSTHTPGPWRVAKRSAASAGSDALDIMCGGIRVAAMGHNPRAIVERDARLIAAAPMMLAALHELAMLIDGQEDIIDSDHGPRPNWAMKVAQIIEPAIVKAEGNT
jgi:hypothetical protein